MRLKKLSQGVGKAGSLMAAGCNCCCNCCCCCNGSMRMQTKNTMK